MTKKRVLHLLSSGGFGGAENVVCTIIENEKDYEMVYCSPDGIINEILEDRKIKHITIKKLLPHKLKRICKDYNIDIIHAHDYKASLCAALSGFKGKIISQLHGNLDFNTYWNFFTIIYSKLMKKFDKIIAVSQEIIDQAIYVKGNEDKFVLITNVVDKKRIIKKSEEFDTPKYDLIYVGRIEEVKRPNIIVEVTKELKNRHKDIKVCIIGTGSLLDNIKELTKKYNLESNIDIIGFKSNPFPYIKNSNIAILPSLHEGLPMSVIECMILNVPVINSGVDGLATLFKNNQEFICNNISDYVCTISKEIEDGLLSKKCSKIIKNEVNMKDYISKINEVYK